MTRAVAGSIRDTTPATWSPTLDQAYSAPSAYSIPVTGVERVTSLITLNSGLSLSVAGVIAAPGCPGLAVVCGSGRVGTVVGPFLGASAKELKATAATITVALIEPRTGQRRLRRLFVDARISSMVTSRRSPRAQSRYLCSERKG